MPKPYRLQDRQQQCADRSSVVSQDFTPQAGGNLNLTSTSGDIHVVQGMGVAPGAKTGAYVYAEASVGSSKSNANSTTWQKRGQIQRQLSGRGAAVGPVRR